MENSGTPFPISFPPVVFFTRFQIKVSNLLIFTAIGGKQNNTCTAKKSSNVIIIIYETPKHRVTRDTGSVI